VLVDLIVSVGLVLFSDFVPFLGDVAPPNCVTLPDCVALPDCVVLPD
jgi:hypothetical protein